MRQANDQKTRVVLFGHFGQYYNFGNESTLQAILYHLRHLLPDPEITCVCTDPESTAAAYNIIAVPTRGSIAQPWRSRNRLVQAIRKVLIGIPNEVCQWFVAGRLMMRTDLFIIPGTGLLTDAFGLMSWGPYNIFKWSLLAKLFRCKLAYVSVGAGPLRGGLGRFFMKAALGLADYRSYRDAATKKYLNDIGLRTDADPIYPDLAFSLPRTEAPSVVEDDNSRTVIGLGLMHHGSMYGEGRPSCAAYERYLETLITFVEWAISGGYDVKLLIGDVGDRSVTAGLYQRLQERLSCDDAKHVSNPHVASVGQLLAEIASTDAVVASRFHNLLLGFLLNKPAVAISFHSKCSSLMNAMGMSEYSLSINNLCADELTAKFRQMRERDSLLKSAIKQKAEGYRKELDEQYQIVVRQVGDKGRAAASERGSYDAAFETGSTTKPRMDRKAW